MAITTKFLEELGIEKEVAEKIFIARNEELEKDKSKLISVQEELKKKTEAFNELNSELETLKAKGASAEEWETKYNALKADNEAKEKQALADKLAREKEENNRAMFNKAVESYGKTADDWNNKFTEEGYYKEFIKALDAPENTGRAHKDILHDLVKNDTTAFKGVTAVKLGGGKPSGIGGVKYTNKSDIMSIKDRTERRNAIAQNLELFGKGE